MLKFKYILSLILLQIILSSATKRIWMGWTIRESGRDGYCQVLGDRGNAFGKYQFDRRYGLVPFIEYCYNYNPTKYSKFRPYIQTGVDQGNTLFANIWSNYCTNYAEEFGKLQDVVAVSQYYEEARRYFKNLYNIDVDTRSPALKGTLFSMAIRSGALCAANKFAGSDFNNDMNMMKTAYATYGDSDDRRWTIQRQQGDAIIAYGNNEGEDVPTSM